MHRLAPPTDNSHWSKILSIKHQACADWLRSLLSLWTDTLKLVESHLLVSYLECWTEFSDTQQQPVSSGKSLGSLRVIRGLVLWLFPSLIGCVWSPPDFEIFLMSPITSACRLALSLSESVSHECALVPLVNQTCFLASALPGNLLLARMCAACVGAWKWTHWTAPVHHTHSYGSSQVPPALQHTDTTVCVSCFRTEAFKLGGNFPRES